MLDDGRVRHARVGAAQLVGDVRVEHRHALDVRLVDDAVVVVPVRRAVVAPVEERVDDDRHHRVPGRVVVVERGSGRGCVVLLALGELVRLRDLVRVGEAVGEQRLVAVDLPLDRLRVRVEQKLRRVAAVAVRGVVGTVHAVAVARTGALPGR